MRSLNHDRFREFVFFVELNPAAYAGMAAAAICVAMALAALWVKRSSVGWLSFSVGMLLLAADSALASAILLASSAEDVVRWQVLRLRLAAPLPGVALFFSLCYSRGNYCEFLRQWRYVLPMAFVVPLLGILGAGHSLSANPLAEAGDHFYIGVGVHGKLIYLCLLLGSVLVLVNLERTFRAAIGIMRWRIKFFILGMAFVFGAKVYTSSQALLYSGTHSVALQVTTVSTLLGVLLILWSFLRTRLADSEIYPSRNVLQHSVTALVAGAYLVSVGIFAKLVAFWGGDPTFPVISFLLMVLVAGLGVVLLSDRVQQRLKLLIARHFRRPVHDVRKVWTVLTERTASRIEQAQLCRAVVSCISETFELLSVSVWLVRERDNSVFLGASTSLTEEAAQKLVPGCDAMEPALQAFKRASGPVDIDACREPWGQALRMLNPDHFGKGGRRVCIPLVSTGELTGFIVVADRVSGLPFTEEDLDLLKCIGDQVACNLHNIQLSQKLVQEKELQAFQSMSAFFVHDLKNTTSTLSLMLRNLASHFGDPRFREDCLRSVSKSIDHINGIIQRLGLLRQELELNKSETDLNELVSSVLSTIGYATGGQTACLSSASANSAGTSCPSFRKDLQALPRILVDPNQLGKVITNLLLNAREAVSDAGSISVRTARENGWVTLAVADNGCGMSPTFIRHSLFQPFQTTKKGGLGIGMFHSKAIVEAHHGRIEVQSEPGKGTTFRILLPVSSTS